MTARTEWSVSEPRTLEIEEVVDTLTVRVVGGAVNVVGTREKGPARVEVGEVTGAPLHVSHEGGTLTVGYEDLPGSGLWSFLDHSGWRRAAVVSVTVPVGTKVDIGGVGAGAVLSHLDGPAVLRTVTGGGTLVGLTGPVRVQTVSGAVQAQDVRGGIRFHSVSGDLTALACGGRLHADSVGGDMTVDLDGAGPTDIGLTTVSGDVALRLPDPADATVEANTTSGAVSNAFDDLRVSGGWGTRRITGRLGTGAGRLRITTVSGGLALLRRPRDEEGAEDDGAPAPADPGAAPGSGGPDTGTTPSTQRKVL